MDIGRLPTDSLIVICAYLSFEDLCSISQVSKRFQSIAQNDQLWQKLLELARGISFETSC
jgi:hypothetical protein